MCLLYRESMGMTIQAATAFRSALLGVKAMHDRNWAHRDLKPNNIGLLDERVSVLLDVGTSSYISAEGSLPPTPGQVGTIGFLAPELELEPYHLSIDIWSMGVILYMLTYGRHPWMLSLNPWRSRKDYEALRDSFLKSYQKAIDRMKRDYSTSLASPSEGYIHREYSDQQSLNCIRE